MVDSDDEDSETSSSSHDVFDTNNDIEQYEDLLLRDGLPSTHLPSTTTWKYNAFTNRGSEFIGGLNKNIEKEDKPFNLKYNTIDRILFEKAKTELKRSLTIIEANLIERVGCSNITPFTAFTSVCPEDFFVLFRTWLKPGVGKKDSNHTDLPFSLGEICEFWRCEIIMMSLELSAVSLRQKVSENEYNTYLKMKEIMRNADKPASSRKAELGVASLPPFSFDPIIDDLILSLNRLWSRQFFAPGCTWVDIDDDKIPHCSEKWRLYGWRTQPTKDKKLKPVIHLMASVSTGWLIWLCPQKMVFNLADMMKNAVNTVLPSGQVAMRAQLVLFLDRGYLELAKNNNTANVTNLIQLMTRLGVKYVGTVKNTPSFPFVIHDHNLNKIRTDQNKVVLQSYGTRTKFSCETKVGNTKMMVSVLRNGIGKIRSARISTNLPLLMDSSWVYELKYGDLGEPDIKRIIPQIDLLSKSSSKAKENTAWETFIDNCIFMTASQRTVDWFLMRMFRFTSTTLHVILNVRNSIYLHEQQIQLLHATCKNIIKINPINDITLDNSLSTSDIDVGDLRTRIQNSQNSDNSVNRKFEDKASAEYYKRGNSRSKAVLQKMCTEDGIAFLERNTRQQLAESLASNYKDKIRDTPVDNHAVTSLQRKQAFMNRMIQHWFMHPFSTPSNSAINVGKQNEGLTLKVLQNYLRSFSNNQFRGGKIKQFGLLANGKVRSCATSPDGVFPLYQREVHTNKFGFVGLCVIEIKTKAVLASINDLEKSILSDGSKFNVCNVGSLRFRELVKEPAFRTQVCQHAAATGLKNVLLVYSLPGALIKKMVLLKCLPQHLLNLVHFQKWLQDEYLVQLYPASNTKRGHMLQLETLGNDYGDEYGYAIEHHTLDIWLRLWSAHDFDVRTKGTPPPCRRLLDINTSCWNKCMGNVDTVRRLLCYHKVKRGSNTAPGSLTWYMIFNYILVNAYRLYLSKMLYDDLNSKKLKSWQQLKNKRKKYLSFRNYLDLLGNRNLFGLFMIEKLYPGLRQKIDHVAKSPLKKNTTDRDFEQEKNTTDRDFEQEKHTTDVDLEREESIFVETHPYRFILHCIDSSRNEYKKRLDKSLKHTLIPNERRNNKDQRQRLRCILCCWICEKEEDTIKTNHSRQGKTTTKLCLTCEIPICTKCTSIFHNESHLPLPVCMNKYTSKKSRSKISKSISRGMLPELYKEGVCTPVKNERKRVTKPTTESTPHKSNKVVDHTKISVAASLKENIIQKPRKVEIIATTQSEDKNIIKVENCNLLNTVSRYYLQQSLRSSMIPNKIKENIDQFGSIQNVNGDGNCGIYSIMEGLHHNSIEFNDDVDIFRRSIVDYIDINSNKVLLGIQFRNKRMSDGTMRGQSRENFIDTVVKEKIWNEHTIFEGGCDSEYWVDSNYVFPIIAQKYEINVVWYTLINANKAKTNAIIWRDKKIVPIERDGIQNPFLVIPGLCWRKIILLTHYKNHYQCIKLHIPV